jgi:parallel beta-helix repeat protein
VELNTIQDNYVAGILIKDPSLPELRKNTVSSNLYQVQMEKHAKSRWAQYMKENPQS